eukprot:COSAG05_NODE_11465_length_512_cov_0.748184_1_plen_89_part_00
MSLESEPELWKQLIQWVADSASDFDILSAHRVQNKALWQRYTRFCDEVASQHGAEAVNEKQLWHYCQPATVEAIVSSSSVRPHRPAVY